MLRVNNSHCKFERRPFISEKVSQKVPVTRQIVGQNGKVVSSFDDFVLETKIVPPFFNPNEGVVYTDFCVDNLQKLNINLERVNPQFIAPDSTDVSSASEYLNSDSLINELDKSINSNSKDKSINNNSKE